MKPRSTIAVNMSPPADAGRTVADAKTIEFAAIRTDITEDGSFRTVMGGLIDFRVVRAAGPGTEDRLVIHIRQTDANVEVSWSRPPAP